MRAYLLEMRDYMPVDHRRFIAAIEAGPGVRDLVLADRDPGLVAAYDECVELVRGFRAKHLEYAATYIQHQAQAGATNPTEVGTGRHPLHALSEEAPRRNGRTFGSRRLKNHGTDRE